MKSSTQLQSAVFHLTPTRTRYDLFIIANEKKEKIASGLLIPFIAHLKAAEDQIAKGGYSVLLEPEAGNDATWFTKGTVERFVRFVSTPEILERVYTTESEILQINEAIAIQGNNDIGRTIEDHPAKPLVSNEGNKPIPDSVEDKAIVLFMPDGHPAEVNESTAQERNSKIQLLKVLETRRAMLQKEQGMAFARAAAAGFDMDHMAPLVSFAECFGASRLMDACLRFIDLWTRKHKSGQWLEIEEAEAMSSKPNLSNVVNNQNELHIGLAPENNVEAGTNTSVDERSSAIPQVPVGQQEYFAGKHPHPMFPPWPLHSPADGLPVFQAYPMHGMPYYQNFAGNSPYFQPPFPPSEDSQFSAGHRTERNCQSMDSRDSNTRSERDERSGKKKSGTVVIRNINYITSKQQTSSASESESESASDSEITPPKILKSSKRKGFQEKTVGETNKYGEEEMINGKETDGGHWQAFQSCLLRATDKNNRVTKDDIQFNERNGRNIVNRRTGNDDFLIGGQENQSNLSCSSFPMDVNGFEGTTNHFNRSFSNDMADESFIVPSRSLSLDQVGNDYRTAIEVDCKNISNRFGNQVNYEPDDLGFIPECGSDKRSTVYDPSLDYDLRFSVEGTSKDKRNKEALTKVNQGSKSSDKDKDQRSKGNLDKKKIGGPIRKGNSSKMSPLEEARARAERLRTYKSDLQKMKKEKEEAEQKRLDALKLERQKRIAARGRTASSCSPLPSLQTRKSLPTKLSPISHRGSKFSDSEPKSSSPLQRSKLRTASLGSIDSRKASKVSRSSNEQSKLRTASLGSIDLQKDFKASKSSDKRSKLRTASLGSIDLQKASKVSKSSDEHSKLRTASLGSIDLQKASKVSKSSDVSHSKRRTASLGSFDLQKDSKVSKSSDASHSKLRTASLGSIDLQKASKVSKSSDASQLKGNRLSRSVPSLSEPKKERNSVTPDSKVSMAWIRRLSEPKTISGSSTSVKMGNTEQVPKLKVLDGPAVKKISAIRNIDQSKVTSKRTYSVGKDKMVAKEMKNSDKKSNQSDADENPIVDKTVVMLEYEQPSVPAKHASEEKTRMMQGHKGTFDNGETIEVVSEYATVRALPSPADKVDREPIPRRAYPSSHEVMTSHTEKQSPKTTSINIGEKPHQAPKTSLEMAPTGVETAKAHVSDLKNQKLEKIPEALEKPMVKEPSKGFKRLLKLGRRNHMSAAVDQSGKPDDASVNGSELGANATNSAASSEVHTLRNLISQEEVSSAGNTPQKPSRHFSLLSPFRSKNSEKKLIT